MQDTANIKDVITWKLPQILEANDISAYKLAKTAEREREPSLYRFLLKKETPRQYHIETLELIISGLRQLGVDVTFDDLFEYSD